MQTEPTANGADRVAGAILVGVGLGFGLPIPWALDRLRQTGDLPMTPWGFRAYSGPFEQLGTEPFTALAWCFAGVCAAEVVARTLLLRGDPRGAKLAAVITPPGVVLGLGFALPIYLASIPLRSGALLAGARTRRKRQS
jgi:hypothetical protein